MIDRHLISLAMALQRIDEDVPRLQGWGRTAASALAAGGRLYACGAGPSARQARHLVTELADPEDDRPPLAAATLAAGLAAPAASSAQPLREPADARTAVVGRVRRHCRPEDVLLCMSATAADDEVAAAAAAAAADAGTKTWALTGQAPNAVARACAEAVCVDAVERTTIEEVHLAAIHIFCAAVNSAVRSEVRAGELAGVRSRVG